MGFEARDDADIRVAAVGVLERAEQLLESVKRESPKARAAKPRFVGIANPSSYCFANATIQCLRHTPRLAEELCAALPHGEVELTTEAGGMRAETGVPGDRMLIALASVVVCIVDP